MHDSDKHEELMELKHDAVPGYKPWFLGIFIVSTLYILLTFFMDWPGAGHGH